MDAAAYLRPELDFRLRFIIQEAWRFCRRGRRAELRGDDIYAAWRLVCGESVGGPIDATFGLSVSRSALYSGAAGFDKSPLDSILRSAGDVSRLLQAVRGGIRSHDSESTKQLVRALASASDRPATARLLAAVVGVLQEEAEIATHQALHARLRVVVAVARSVLGAPGAEALAGDILVVLCGILLGPAVYAPPTPAPAAADLRYGRYRPAASQFVSDAVAMRGEAAGCVAELFATLTPGALPGGAVAQAVALFLRVIFSFSAGGKIAAGTAGQPGVSDASVAASVASADAVVDQDDEFDGPRKRPRFAIASADTATDSLFVLSSLPEASAYGATLPAPASASVFGALCGLRLLAPAAGDAAVASTTARALQSARAAWKEAEQRLESEPTQTGVEQLLEALWIPHCLREADAALLACMATRETRAAADGDPTGSPAMC